MKQVALPKYEELNLFLLNTKLKLHPSQVHGLTCGLLCGQNITEPKWEELITGQDLPETQDDSAAAKAHTVFQNLYEISEKQLADYLFDFELLLPDDSEELTLRAEALTLWCQGFLTGLNRVNISPANHESADVSEAINDLIEIAKMNYEEVVDSDEDEAAYVELVEFVRMAVILIFQDEKSEQAKEVNASNQNLH